MSINLSVINFKGGVGKTTLSFHLAAHLASKEKRVLVVDVDHQSSLSIALLRKLWEPRVKTNLTSNAIFQSFCKRGASIPDESIIFRNPIGTRSPSWNLYPSLDLVSAQFELDDTEIEMASTTWGTPVTSEWEKRALLSSWLDKVGAEENYDYVIFDCPPATKLVSQNALAASDYFLIPVIPDEMSSRGVTHFTSLVRDRIDAKLEFLRTSGNISDRPRAYRADTKLAGIIPYMAKSSRAASGMTNVHTTQLAALRRQWGADILSTVVKHFTGVPESINSGWPVWNWGGQNAARAQSHMRKLCVEIEARLK